MSEDPSAPERLRARLTPTDQGLTVDQLVDLRPTPGNVGLCFVGGGSRAMTAGMGQLRALAQLELGGQSLLGLAKAISTVSGGSWLGVPFTFLDAGTSDGDYLNGYVPDPARLVPTATPGHSPAETLDTLPAGNVGNVAASRAFAPPALAFEALALYTGGVAADMIWQTLVGIHVLKPYGLFPHDRRYRPTSLFSYDAATLRRDVVGPNPRLGKTAAHLVAAGARRTRRPFLVANAAMFLAESGTAVRSLAPVVGTPVTTGILGAPEGTDANGKRAGGGGVTSFAFSSNPVAVDGDEVEVEQPRRWALSDLAGASSAFFAETVEDQLAIWRHDEARLLRDAARHLDAVLRWIDRHLLPHHAARAKALLHPERLIAAEPKTLGRMRSALAGLQDLIPAYAYWPVRDAAPARRTLPSRFADGGNLENNGIAALLAFEDVERLIAFVNTSTAIAPGARGVIDENGDEVPGTQVIVDGAIPPLFGYQPYDPRRGYVPFSGEVSPANAIFRHNQVFPASAFADLVRGLWRVTGNEEHTGSDRRAALYRQTLEVVDNAWFGVRGTPRRQVDVLWFHLNRIRDWYDRLRPEVQRTIGPFAAPTLPGFPGYSIFRTHLSATEINLLAHLTAWSLAAPENRDRVLAMFEG